MKIKHITRFSRRPLLTTIMITAIFLPAIIRGQVGDSLIDIDHIKYAFLLKGAAAWEKTLKNTVSGKAIARLPFTQIIPPDYNGKISPQTTEKDIFLKFTLFNPADTAKKICFYPGHFACVAQLFMASPGNIAGTFHEIHDTSVIPYKFPGFQTIHLQPHQKAVCFARLQFARTDINLFVPQLAEPDFVQRYTIIMADRTSMLDRVTYVVSGLLIMMILYSLAVYLQNRSDEFLYYAGYALSTGTLLFLISFLGTQPTPFNIFYGEYLDLMILCTGVICYLIFMRKFLNTREQHRFLDRVFRIGGFIIIAMMLLFSAIYFLTDHYTILHHIENICKQVMLTISAIFIVYGIRKNNRLMNYLVAGNTALFLFSILSFLVQQDVLFTYMHNNTNGIFGRSLFYYEIGLLLELTFFLSGLAYKNREDIIERAREKERLQLENEIKEFEKQVAVMAAQQEERDRISADMHDELGSGVTAIRLMSEIVKSKMKEQSFPEIEKISNSANDLLGKMNTIIWTMKSSNDTLESLVAYIRAHAIEFFDNTPVDCVVHVPEYIPAGNMSGEKRRNIFLSIKESLNNIMKHSQAGKVVIDIMAEDGKLMIRVKDNGIGIDTDKLRRFGNGLSNMRRRMENIGGEFMIESNAGGSLLIFEAPL